MIPLENRVCLQAPESWRLVVMWSLSRNRIFFLLIQS